ncbi:hypothetical protein LXT21_09560 [Myxococcus sp. K38C18041901]|uniref:hypothetical protein n=1 Tax=Myxococcus guangdongensis TaxID=2906760 RepID=UPI0020A7F888|nr:hypothetical protein [Myxococcus guangdongensis]MCP3059017.1 hypothetical protein [Myxococcus guangdongensis]
MRGTSGCGVLLLGVLACGGEGRQGTGPLMEGTGGSGMALERPLEKVLITCPLGLGEAKYGTGLKGEPGDSEVSFLASVSGCVTVLGSAVTSATLGSETPSLVRGLSCADLSRAGAGRQVVKWNTAETSTVLMGQSHVSVQEATTVVTQTGKVLSGKFQGATAVRTTTYMTADVERGCHSPEGLKDLKGPVTFSVTYP